MAENTAYRSIVILMEYISWLLGHLLRLRYAVRANCPSEVFDNNSEHCLILASAYKTIFDPWLPMIALDYRHVDSARSHSCAARYS